MNKRNDQRQQLPQSYYTDKAGTAAVAAQPIVYPELDAEGSTPPVALNRDSAAWQKDRRKWGTKAMGAPAAPSAHPQNQEAAMWTATEEHRTPSSYIVQPSTRNDQRQQLPQSYYTDKAGTATVAAQPIVYPELDAEGSTPPVALNRDSAAWQKDRRKWGTKAMGAPAAPSAHPQNQEAGMWTATEEHRTPSSYIVQPSPVQHSKCPINSAQHCFNKWTKKAENLSLEVWTNLNTGKNIPDAAWGKLTLGAKALTEGGFEALFRQAFSASPEEKLQKAYACYLSTSTGPVAGTLYISTMKIAFCSDRPLSFTAPSGEASWSYYRIAIPLANVRAVDPSTNKEKAAEKYIQIVTVDGHDFWLMGFVNYQKAVSHLQESVTRTQPAQHRPHSSTVNPTAPQPAQHRPHSSTVNPTAPYVH